MTKFRLPPTFVASWEDRLVETMTRSMHAAVGAAADRIGAVITADAGEPYVSMDDLAVISGQWLIEVDSILMPLIEQVYLGASVVWTATLREEIPAWAAVTVPAMTMDQAREYLAGARNRLRGVGDELWLAARASLLEGFTAGETITQLAARITDTVDQVGYAAVRTARTEVVAASNAGSFTMATLLGEDIGKEWAATFDNRTRPTHRAADGQTVPLLEPFQVGGRSLMYPGDPTGPAVEVIQCRCTTLWDVPAPSPATVTIRSENPLTAAAQNHTGAMVALVPATADAERLAVAGGEPADELHCTVLYLGEADAIPDSIRQAVIDAVTEAVAGQPVFDADAFALSMFNPPGRERSDGEGRDTCITLGLGGSDLADVRDLLETAVIDAMGGGDAMADQHAPWAAHLTLAYSDDLDLFATLLDRTGPLSMDRVRVAFGGDATDIPLDRQAGQPTMETVMAEQKRGVPGCDCGAAAVSTGADIGTQADSIGMSDTGQAGDRAGDVEHFHTVMIIEGVSTGMRTFSPGALDWRTPPFAFRWQEKEPEMGGHAHAVGVGNITRVERVGDEIHGWGRLDLGSDDGLEFGRKLAAGFAPWVSIGLDEQPVDVEYVWPEGADPTQAVEDDDIIGMLFAEPEQYVFHSGRIGELTAVTVPAQQEAFVEALPALREELARRGVLVAAAVASHDSATVDEPWDDPANEARLPSPMSETTGKDAYAWIDSDAVEDGQMPKSAGRFIHHTVSSAGSPGAANLVACSAGIGVLNGGRGGTTIPDSDRQGVYDHLAAHLRDGDREPPELLPASANTRHAVDAALIAAAHTIVIPNVAPACWFTEPEEDSYGALTITDEGRVFGWVALKGMAHRAFRDQRVEVPMGNVDYSRWMGGEAIVEGGTRVVAGVITMDCGHMSPHGSTDAGVRMEHYENTCSVLAKASIGERPGRGVWIAGALEPFVTAEQVSKALGCRLSGDWAPHRDRAGWREFVAALLVPVPGFAQSRTGPSVRVRDGVLVAASVPVGFRRVRHPAAGHGVDLRPALERVARSIGRDAGSRMGELHTRIHAQQNCRKP